MLQAPKRSPIHKRYPRTERLVSVCDVVDRPYEHSRRTSMGSPKWERYSSVRMLQMNWQHKNSGEDCVLAHHAKAFFLARPFQCICIQGEL